MMRSLYSGVSGIKSHQTRMDVIGNNNTIGFKSSRVTFADMLSQSSYSASSPTETRGGTNPRQIGLGEAVSSIDMIMTDGSAQATGKNTDVALSGNAFMILAQGTDVYYTRDGAFEFDANGNYVLPGSGYHVQGWNAIDGTLTTSGVPEDIVVKSGKTMAATATTNLEYAGNLNAGALTITSITYTGDPSGDATTVANNRQLDSMVVTYTDGSTDTITAETIDYSSGSTDTTATMAGQTVRVGQNRKVLNAEGNLVTKTVASVAFDMVSVYGNTSAGGIDSTGSDTASYNFTSGSFTIYDPGDGSEGAGDSTTLTTQSVNVDGTNVIAATLTLSDGSTLKVSSGFYEIGHSVPVTTVSTIYDAEGNMHEVTLLVDKAGENNWRAYIAPTTGQMGYQTVVTKTEDDGTSSTIYLNRQEDATTGAITTALSDINFTELGAIDTALTSGGSLYLQYGNGNGAQETTVAVDYNDITQYSGSNTIYPTTDGNSLGTLNSISIDVSGVISGTYTNGIIQQEAQIAVAQFINSAGLDKQGTSLYKVSNNSGSARVGTVTDFGFSFTPSALEMSNVELSSELVDMIVTQRGFQSNSKVITVGDEMLETIVNMKR